MNIKTIQPSDDLRPYIEFYYLIKNDEPNFNNIHYSFPHTVNAVSIYQNASFTAGLGALDVHHNVEEKFLTIIQAKCQIPLRVEMNGRTNRITIWFKPLGINHFLKSPLSKTLSEITQTLNEWDEDPNYNTYLANSFSTNEPEIQIRFLEDFLRTKLKSLSLDIAPIAKAERLLKCFDREYSIQDILQETNLTLRSFNRHFKKTIGVSPVEYRRIARFRHSLNNKLLDNQFKRLTDIGLESNFYDQSYFIKLYQKFTGSNPKSFFGKIEKLDNNRLVFEFIKK